MRLESASSPQAADCFEQILKSPPPEFKPTGGLAAGVDFGFTGHSAVLVQVKFTSPDSPPAATILFASGNPRLRRLVEQTVAGYRMTCMPAGKSEIVATQLFFLRDPELQLLRLKQELGLVELLRLSKDVRAQPVRFDTTAMACPFKVQFGPYRPYTTNSVKEVGESVPARQPFIDWLAQLTLDLPTSFMRTAMGEQSTVTVPCTILDFT